jgi:hypothetical protein
VRKLMKNTFQKLLVGVECTFVSIHCILIGWSISDGHMPHANTAK